MRLLLVLLTAGWLAGTAPATAADDGTVAIPAGRFQMGATAEDAARDHVIPFIAEGERPRHEVAVAAFRLARHTVTRGEFARFVAATGYAPAPGCQIWYGETASRYRETAGWRDPGFPQTDRDPVVCVGRDDVLAYIAWLSKRTGRAWRLPTEAEWEYAARAGEPGSRPWGDHLAQQCRHANGAAREYGRALPEPAFYLKDFPGSLDVNRACEDGVVFTAPVGAFRPNRFGLYDMLGNVWQWTADCRRGGYDGAPADGRAWREAGCTGGVWRGGAWYDGPWLLRVTINKNSGRQDRDNGVGFRLARDAAQRPTPAGRPVAPGRRSSSRRP